MSQKATWVMQKYKKMDKRRSKVKNAGRKRMRIKMAHALEKIFHKREICFKEHSRIRLATTYFTHMHVLV